MIKNLKNKLQKDKHLKELFQGSSLSFIYKLLGTIFGYILTYFIANKFGAEIMGIFALSMAFLNISTILSKFGIDTAIIRFVASNKSRGNYYLVYEYYKKSFLFSIFSSIFITIIVFFTSPYIAELIFHKSHLYIYFQIIAIGILPFTLFFLHAEAIRGLKRVGISSFLKNIPIPLFTLIFLLFLANFKIIKDIKAVPNIAYLSSILVTAFLSIVIWFKISNLVNIKNTESNTPKHISFKEIFRVSFPMMLTSSLLFINNWTDILMLGMFLNEEIVGIYNVVNKIVNIMMIPIIAIVSIAAPKFAEFWGKQDIDGLRKFTQQISKITFILGLISFIILSISSYPILNFFGSEFTYGETALIILLLSMLFYLTVGPIHILMNMTGKEVIVQNIMLLSAIINIILNFFLIPTWDLNGAAIATFISKLFFYASAFILVKKYYGFYSFNFKNILKLRL